jgi:arylsulfate sulfotransferase
MSLAELGLAPLLLVLGQQRLFAQEAPPTITVGPVLIPGATNVPLAASIELETNVPTKAALFVDDGFRTFWIPPYEPGFETEHELMVLGVHPDRTNRITVVVEDSLGQQAIGGPVTFVTPPLPATFPPVVFQQLDAQRMEPGFTLMEVQSFGGTPQKLTLVFDDGGQVVWVLDGSMGSTRTRNGHLLIRDSPLNAQLVEEIDMLGNSIQTWYPAGLNGGSGAPAGATLVDLNSFHHEFTEMPAGEDSDFLTLSTELQVYPNYPSSYFNPGQTVASANVIGDVIAEIRRDGTVVREKKLLDILDPYRAGYDSLTLAWRAAYGAFATEWAHASSVMFDPGDDTYIVSLRHQDCVVKVRRSTPGTGSPDDVVWILANPAGWRAPWRSKLLLPAARPMVTSYQKKWAKLGELEFEWPYHQHAAFLNSRGNLVCFDNGNYRATPPNPFMPVNLRYSRAVEYRIDERYLTVEQIWAAGGRYDSDPYRVGYSGAMSSAESQLVTGNVLVDAGFALDATTGATFVHLLELEHRDPPVPVMELTIADPSGLRSWGSYRARRIPSLYP